MKTDKIREEFDDCKYLFLSSGIDGKNNQAIKEKRASYGGSYRIRSGTRKKI